MTERGWIVGYYAIAALDAVNAIVEPDPAWRFFLLALALLKLTIGTVREQRWRAWEKIKEELDERRK